MASEANRAQLQRRVVEAGPNDLLIAIEADSDWNPHFGPLSSGSRAIQRGAGLLIGPSMGYSFS